MAFLPLLMSSAYAASSPAFELGIAGVTGGDDHADPAALMRATLGNSFHGQMLLYGADFGPVSARTIMLSGGSVANLKGFERLQTQFGLTLMDEYIGIYSSTRKRPDQTDQPKISKHNLNIGAMMGLRFQALQKSNYTASFGWESHLFLAGSAGFYLVFGVKQAWYASVGVSI